MRNLFSLTVFRKVFTFAKAHKIISAVIAVAVVGGGYWTYNALVSSGDETRYILGTVERGTVIASVSASGQVSASNQVDVSSKSSGELVYLNAKVGQQIGTRTLIGQTDATDAAFELETARLSYEELVTVGDDELRDAEDALEEAERNLGDSYVDARATLASAVTDMSDVIAGLDDLFGGYLNTSNRFDLTKTAEEYVERAEQAWYDADDVLFDFSKKYRTISNETSDDEIESLLSEANSIANAVAQTAKYSKDAVIYLRDREDNDSTTADEAYTTASESVTTANSTVSETLSARNSLTDNKRTLKNTKDDLQDLKEGPDTLDVRAEELSLRQKEQAHEDHFIRAPFAGVIASVPVQRGDTLNSGATVATLITKQKIAEVSLNEVDAAKISVGDKATLTFDALEELSLTGSVVEIDLVGTVNQGVVSYTVKISFDTQDERVKSGMTVNASIQTDVRQDVLAVPSSAVKTQNGVSYVQVFNPPLSETGGAQGIVSNSAPRQIEVTVGISDDTNVEILSGLEEGQQIVTRTVSGTAAANAASPTNTRGGGFGGPGIRF
ncbi:hypothetical protein A2851_01410 [Candidatus Kaiserbacteria bacterium RIFCSPHIGHO2_01_FULL_53_29]|uniref:YknX-like beta-barrel domain-containing protein n=1 Tax=Candidatus Kaiserbacteria bacterium RIFCSPHIGHO2_01_FULL_53_29 TaxID=1798480 RepID=A0A1F6CYC4_9BACT|nr:MAG: hypothetical protein A2851_01410 [Candidatus Kaiserbacteria bacterium RIFCSPHIGHO2_01_FULL_53_29]